MSIRTGLTVSDKKESMRTPYGLHNVEAAARQHAQPSARRPRAENALSKGAHAANIPSTPAPTSHPPCTFTHKANRGGNVQTHRTSSPLFVRTKSSGVKNTIEKTCGRIRSEERRVGKECRSRGSTANEKK